MEKQMGDLGVDMQDKAGVSSSSQRIRASS